MSITILEYIKSNSFFCRISFAYLGQFFYSSTICLNPTRHALPIWPTVFCKAPFICTQSSPLSFNFMLCKFFAQHWAFHFLSLLLDLFELKDRGRAKKCWLVLARSPHLPQSDAKHCPHLVLILPKPTSRLHIPICKALWCAGLIRLYL